MKGIKLWEEVEKTNPHYTKRVTISGHTFTTIDAYYQIKRATELWGSYGSTWGLKDSELELKDIGESTLAIYKATFYYPEGSFEIRNSIAVKYKVQSRDYIKVDDDFAKKLETDTITKALSRLGFNADVFLGKFDDNRYVNELKKAFSATQKASDDISTDSHSKNASEGKETPSTAKSKDSWIPKFLKQMATLKNQLGDKRYYAILKDFNIQHANKVKTKEEATKVYKAVLARVKLEENKEKLRQKTKRQEEDNAKR